MVKDFPEYNIILKDMTLENYVQFYNKTLYPLNYPYQLRVGLKASPEEDILSLELYIGIPRENFSIDEPTEYDFKRILSVYGETSQEVINAFNAIELDIDLKESFKSL